MKYDVFALGHALVDTEFLVSDEQLHALGVVKGEMTLIDNSRQAELLTRLEMLPKHQACGGSAANTLATLLQLGGSGFYCGKVGDDLAGQFFADELKASGAGVHVVPDPIQPTGHCLVFITPDAERSMNTCLAASALVAASDIDEHLLARSQWLYLEGYLVSGASGLAALQQAQLLAQKHQVKVALTLSDVAIVRYFEAQLHSLTDTGIDLVFCNQAEAFAFCQTQDLLEAGRCLSQFSQRWVITCGADGALLFDGQQLIKVAAIPVAAVNTNGAGDTYAGAFLYGLTQGLSFEMAGRLAACAAARVVAQAGPRLNEREIARARHDWQQWQQ